MTAVTGQPVFKMKSVLGVGHAHRSTTARGEAPMPTDTRGDMEQAPGVATVRSSKAAWEGSVPADVIPTTWCGERALRGAVGRGRAQQGAVGGAGRGGAL